MNVLGGVTDAVRARLGLHEGVLINEDEQADGQIDLTLITRLMSSKVVRQALTKSEALTSLRDDALDALTETVRLSVEPVRKLSSVDSIVKLERITGKKWDPGKVANELSVDVDVRDIDKVVTDLTPALVQRAAQPFTKRLKRMTRDIKTLMRMYEVPSSDPAGRSVVKILESGVRDLSKLQ